MSDSRDQAAALATQGVTKRFPGVVANDRVDFELQTGEVHALLGENGSGKTTLCKVLTGLYQPDSGGIFIDGTRVRLSSPAEAYEAGIFMVHQHFSLVERMTVAENVVLGWSRAGKARYVKRAVEEEVATAAQKFQIDVHPSAPIWQLSVGERQRVEILKALYRGARILILDEPTTVLTPQEAQLLFASLRRMAHDGCSVIFVSHKLREVLAACDRVTVLRHGRTAGTLSLRDQHVDTRTLARMMVGREVDLDQRIERSREPSPNVVLKLNDLIVHNDFGRPVVKGVSLDVHAGEILAVAGVAGNGQRELADVICGLRRSNAGEVVIDGRQMPTGNPRVAIDRGVGYVPEDRFGVGLAPGLTLAENILLKAFRSRRFSRGPLLRRRRILEHTRELLERFGVKGAPETLARQLSGGNAQKVLLAREISAKPRLLVVATPTRGLDVSATEGVRRLLVEEADLGAAVLMISEDLDEITNVADRIAVMYEGRITGVLDARGVNMDQVGLLMTGGHEPEPS